MSEYPAIFAAGRLKSFVEQIPGTGVPDKVTTNYLQSRGYKSSNDRGIISVLKHIGLIDNLGAPTQPWQQLRDQSKARHVMGQLVRQAYRPLFHLYPDACNQPDNLIRDFMRTKTKTGDRMVLAMVTTFKTLCELSDFSPPASSVGQAQSSASSVSAAKTTTGPATGVAWQGSLAPEGAPMGPQVTINLQIHLPDTPDYDYIDGVFESIARHLLGRQSEPEDEELEDRNFDVPNGDDEEPQPEEATLPGL